MNHLVVKLNDILVGDLRLRSGDSWEFRFRPEYRDLHVRPVLGQFFEDDLNRSHRANLSLPPFFSNLLPEGFLRALVARQANFNEQREALLLEALGMDLPGAVIVERGDGIGIGIEVESSTPPTEVRDRKSRLKFSLAGVQLKFSVVREGDRLTLPATGQGGDWIVKLPDLHYPRVPANEFSILGWAAASGIVVPDHKLMPLSEISGLPEGVAFPESETLALRRYDRKDGRRVHQEDFAQVLGLYPAAKYDEFNYETIGNVIHAVAGPEALIEYARRLAFVILSGNGDAHHKNWSLLYEDGRRASLTPAYDLVFTKAYFGNDNLALRLSRSKRFADVTIESFRRLARKCSFDEARLAEVVGEAVERIRRTWAEVGPDMPMAAESKVKLARHLDSVRL